jgi:surface antigen
MHTGSVNIDTESAKQPAFAELRAKLDDSDRNIALNVPAGGADRAWRWRHACMAAPLPPDYRRDQTGLCRQLTYSPSLGTFVREVEGIACRERGGGWSLQG